MAGSQTFVKRRPDAPTRFFEAEAAGLRWLGEAKAAGGARVVEVIDVAPGRHRAAAHPRDPPDTGCGRARSAPRLAVTHAPGRAAFGAPPTGWRRPAVHRQPTAPGRGRDVSWGRFYARDRILPYLDIAVEAGGVTPSQLPDIREAVDRIASGELDDDEPPARIHGDLWNGNLLWDARGGILIDPAAHGGHRETDLAMLALFGCPYLDEIVGRLRRAAAPLRAGLAGAHPAAPAASARRPRRLVRTVVRPGAAPMRRARRSLCRI